MTAPEPAPRRRASRGRSRSARWRHRSSDLARPGLGAKTWSMVKRSGCSSSRRCSNSARNRPRKRRWRLPPGLLHPPDQSLLDHLVSKVAASRSPANGSRSSWASPRPRNCMFNSIRRRTMGSSRCSPNAMARWNSMSRSSSSSTSRASSSAAGSRPAPLTNRRFKTSTRPSASGPTTGFAGGKSPSCSRYRPDPDPGTAPSGVKARSGRSSCTPHSISGAHDTARIGFGAGLAPLLRLRRNNNCVAKKRPTGARGAHAEPPRPRPDPSRFPVQDAGDGASPSDATRQVGSCCPSSGRASQMTTQGAGWQLRGATQTNGSAVACPMVSA